MSQAKVSVASVLDNRVITFIDIDNDFDCAICFQVADNPVRCSVSCAGVFCNGCMSNVARKTTCPSCNKNNITASRDVVLRNQILKHQVYCPNKGADDATSTSSTQRKRNTSPHERCTWIGRYDELGAHLNVCECEAVPCTNDGCQEKIERRELEDHELACVHRKVKCDHCNVMVKAAAMNNHLAQCPEMKISCECDFECSRKLLKEHRDKDCPVAEVECEVVGCGAKMERKDYEEHQAETAQHHVRLLSAELRRQSADVRKLSAEVQNQSAQVQRLTKTMQVKWRITDIAAKLRLAAFHPPNYDSIRFDVIFQGNHKLFVRAQIQINKMLGLSLRKDFAMSDNDGRLNMGGTSITVTKTGLVNVKHTLPHDKEGDCWDFQADMTHYIDDDGINVIVDIKLNDEAIVL